MRAIVCWSFRFWQGDRWRILSKEEKVEVSCSAVEFFFIAQKKNIFSLVEVQYCILWSSTLINFSLIWISVGVGMTARTRVEPLLSLPARMTMPRMLSLCLNRSVKTLYGNHSIQLQLCIASEMNCELGSQLVFPESESSSWEVYPSVVSLRFMVKVTQFLGDLLFVPTSWESWWLVACDAVIT